MAVGSPTTVAGAAAECTAFPIIPVKGTVARLIGAARLDDKPFAPHCACMTTANDEDARHKAKMANRKAIQDAEVAAKTIEKGLLIVHTGKGKGKSTAAFGLMLRALGRGFRCGVVQFGKGAWQSGERSAIEKFGAQVEWHTLGEGFTWETQDRARDVAAAERAWAATTKMMADPSIRMIVLDELNITLRYDHLDAAMVIAALKAKRADQHIVVTGRNAKQELIEAADLVTEMTHVKHHFAAGVKAQEGIEF
jgi:cob(I)alamin adenosyltransferase